MKISKNYTINEYSIDLGQSSDSCDQSDLGQTLNIKTQDAGAGKYLVLQTERWAIDDINEFCETLKSIASIDNEHDDAKSETFISNKSIENNLYKNSLSEQ